MASSIEPERLRSRTRVLSAAVLAGGVLVAGCGGGSGNPPTAGGASTSASTVAAAATTRARSTTSAAASSSGSSWPSGGSGTLAFAACMRASGVPNFPDPQPESGELFEIPAGANPAAPAFRAARAKCQKLLPNRGGPGSGPPPSDQTLAKLLRIAVCMRQHRVPQFPDPRTSVPANPTGIQEITNFDGAILLVPTTINLQSPAYKQALTACDAPPLGLPH